MVALSLFFLRHLQFSRNWLHQLTLPPTLLCVLPFLYFLTNSCCLWSSIFKLDCLFSMELQELFTYFRYLTQMFSPSQWIMSFHFVAGFLCLSRQIQKKYCYDLCQSVLPLFFSKSFMVSDLTFRSLSLFLYLFPIVYSCLLCHRLSDCKCVGLFMGCLFCSVDLCVFFCDRNTLF